MKRRNKCSRQIRPETVAAIGELARAAIKHVTGEDAEEPIDVTICRGPAWCGVKDGVEVNESEVETKR